MWTTAGLADETVYLCWSHSSTATTFINVLNAGSTTVTAMLALDNSVKIVTIPPESAVMFDTTESWYISGDTGGMGTLQLTSTQDNVYIFGCVYNRYDQDVGYLIPFPDAPYGQ